MPDVLGFFASLRGGTIFTMLVIAGGFLNSQAYCFADNLNLKVSKRNGVLVEGRFQIPI